MSSSDTIALLNRIHVILYRSLPMYLAWARPWSNGSQDAAHTLLDRIVTGQRQICDRLCTLVLELGGTIEYGHFPMSFTSLHDCSLDYVLRLALARQEKEVALLTRLSDELRLVPVAQALALEALGESKANRDMLRESLALPASA
jgi:hypothetical protein